MDAKLNQLPKIDDFRKAYILAQYPHENGYRAATYEEFYNWINLRLELSGVEMAPVQGGASAESATVIPTGPSGQNRKMDASPGWYSVGGVPVEAAKGTVWKWFWNGTTWSLVDMGELPANPVDGEVEAGNQYAVSGGTVYETLFNPESNIPFTVLPNTAIGIGTTPPTIVASTREATSILFKIKGGVSYVLKNDTVGTDRCRVALFNSYPNIGSSADKYYDFDDTRRYGYNNIESNPSNEYMVIQVTSFAVDSPIFLVREGSSLPTSENKSIKSSLIKLDKYVSITPDFYDLINSNSYFYNSFTHGEILVTTGVDFIGDGSGFAIRLKSGYIPIKNSDSVTMLDDNSLIAVFLYDENYNYLGYQPGTNTYKFTNGYYFRLLVRNKSNANISPSDYENKVLIKLKSEDSENNLISLGMLYNAPLQPDMTGNTLNSKPISFFYNILDQLTSDFPDIISKTVRGYASDAGGLPDTNLPMNEYVIKPPQRKYFNTRKIGKVLISAGLHGNEKAALYGLCIAIDQLIRESADNEILLSILSNFEIKVLFTNPYGVNANTRKNARGVDLNRNFSPGWAESTDPAKGSAPYSELESQVASDWLTENNDCDVFVDYHNTGEEYYRSYIVCRNEEVRDEYLKLGDALTTRWAIKHGIPYESDFGIRDSSGPYLVFEALEVHGINNSSLCEIAWNVNGVRNNAAALTTSLDFIVNYLSMVFRIGG